MALVRASSLRGVEAARRFAATFSLLLLLFFNFPIAGRAMAAVGIGEAWHPVGWLVTATVVGTAAFLLGRRSWFQTYVALVGIGLLVVPLVEIAGQLPAVARTANAGANGTTEGTPDPTGRDEQPNIYYFMVDGYARQDVVEELTGVDVSPFTTWLEDRGFEVSDRALANYTTTFLSVAATLEMEYLADHTEEIARGPSYYRYIRGDNRTVRTLRERGYRYIHAFPGLFQNSRCSGIEDQCIGTAETLLSETDLALLETTPLWPFLPNASRNQLMARNVNPLYVTREALSAPSVGEPYFLFAHLLNPHPPYLRTAECEVRDIEWNLTNWGRGRGVDQYGDAVRCLNRQFTDAVELILREDPDPIIIFQADHGHGRNGDWHGKTLDHPRVQNRLSIMSAIRLPEGCGTAVPEDLTPVNTFRIALACLDGEEPDLLPNRHYGVAYGNSTLARLAPDAD